MSKAQKKLLAAVLEPRKPGALAQISEAVLAGADPNGICPETSTSRGPVRAGSTLLTHSVHEEATRAVARLLECGADPNLEDENGWTPWMASTLAGESKRRTLQSDLKEHGAADDRGHIGELARAIGNGDLAEARTLVRSSRDFEALSRFRVDLIGTQISTRHHAMLDYLLRQGVPPGSTHLVNAVRNDDADSVRLLLEHGQPPESERGTETQLMVAAGRGNREIVELLLDAGADVNRSADDEGEWTPSFYARRGGHESLAEWLKERMSAGTLANQQAARDARNPKFEGLYEAGTSGEDLSTDDIVGVLERWDAAYGVTVIQPEANGFVVQFGKPPSRNDGALLDDVEALCIDHIASSSQLVNEISTTGRLTVWFD